MERLTYKSSMGDYGSEKHFDNEWEEKCALRNALGAYEDLGCTPEELERALKRIREFISKFESINVRKEEDGRFSMSAVDLSELNRIIYRN